MTDSTRTAVSQPEPEGLSDEELLELMPQQFRDDLVTVSRMAAHGAGPDVGAGLFRISLNTGALNFARAVEAATLARVQGQPVPPDPGEVEELAQPRSQAEMLAVRPMMEQIAAMGDCIGQQTVGQIMAISQRAAAWLAENPPWQPVAIEPRGCPTPGACSCVMPSTSTAHALPLPGEVEE